MSARRQTQRVRVCLLLLVLCALCACDRHPATRADCDAIFDAIVTRELQERGFRDPALASRKRQELRRELASELARCTGRPLRHAALACVKRARNVEQISHRCLH
jgi:hypothetical protein